jgi:hypothetical protein
VVAQEAGDPVSDSTIYTIGTALSRARDNDLPVDVLAEGQWIAGRVLALDSHGLVLTNEELGYAVIRLASVTVVRVIDPDMARPARASGVASENPPLTSSSYY